MTKGEFDSSFVNSGIRHFLRALPFFQVLGKCSPRQCTRPHCLNRRKSLPDEDLRLAENFHRAVARLVRLAVAVSLAARLSRLILCQGSVSCWFSHGSRESRFALATTWSLPWSAPRGKPFAWAFRRRRKYRCFAAKSL